MIDCAKALQSDDKEFIGRHIAALKWYHENFVRWGQPERALAPFLKKAIVQRRSEGGAVSKISRETAPDCVLYKFSLYRGSGERQLSDESSATYDFYGVWIDEKTRRVYNTAFVYHGPVRYRPSYDSFVFHILEDAEKAYRDIRSDDHVTTVKAVGQLSLDRGSRAVSAIHQRLKENISKGKGLSYTSSCVTRGDGFREWGFSPTENETLISALAKQEAQVAVPTLRGLLVSDCGRHGIARDNLLYYIYAITREPVEYSEDGKKKIYHPDKAIREGVTPAR